MRNSTGWPRALRAWQMAACVLAASTCAAPQPSREPLGWGPLPEGTPRVATPATKKSRVSRRGMAAARSDSAAGADAGGSPPPAEGPLTGKDDVSGSAKASEAPASAGATAKTAASFAGDYRGEDVAIYRMSGMPDRTERDPNARITAKAASDTAVDFVLVDSSNGNEICTLTGTLTDAGATIAAGQRCFEQSGAGASVTAQVTRGSAKLDGARLLFEIELDVQMQVGDTAVDGTLEYHFDGTRQ